MVCEWGMSEKIGPLTFGKREEHIFLGREFAQRKDYSEATAIEIDKEVRRIVLENLEQAKMLLTKHIDKLHAIAKALLDKEVLNGTELDSIVFGTASA
jgi:cell division protease FtsH